jgi:hypothetical protein
MEENWCREGKEKELNRKVDNARERELIEKRRSSGVEKAMKREESQDERVNKARESEEWKREMVG